MQWTHLGIAPVLSNRGSQCITRRCWTAWSWRWCSNTWHGKHLLSTFAEKML